MASDITRKRNEQVAAVITLSELGYPKPTWNDARRLVKTLNRDAAFILLAQFNLFLAVASIQSHQKGSFGPRRWAQQKILSHILSEARLAELKDKLGNADLADRILVHRAFALAALRLVAVHASPEGGNKLETIDDMSVLGELALIVNSATEPSARQPTACEIAAQMSPSRDLENHPDLGRTLVRMARMLGVHLPRRAEGEPASEIARVAERVFTFVTGGFNFESFRDMTFAMFSYYQMLDLPSVLKHQGVTYFNPSNPGNFIKSDILNVFLRQQAVAFEDVPQYLATGGEDARLLTDFTHFRQKPFWKFKNGDFLCVDPGFLMAKLAEGTYWWVMDGLGDGADLESKERRAQFSSLWGYVFEDYVDELLQYAHEGKAQQLHPHPFYMREKEEAFDGVITDGSDFIAMQCKGTFLPIDAKYSGECEPFLAGLNKRFGSEPGAAAEQLIRNIEYVFGLDGSRRKMGGVPTDGVRKVYPLAIVQEPLLGFWLPAKLLVENFVARAQATLWTLDVDVRPVVFMTIEEIEEVVEHIRAGDFTLVELLRDKLGNDRDHKLSVSQYLNLKFLPSRGCQGRRNEFLSKELAGLKKKWRKRIKSDFYSSRTA